MQLVRVVDLVSLAAVLGAATVGSLFLSCCRPLSAIAMSRLYRKIRSVEQTVALGVAWRVGAESSVGNHQN